MKLVRFFAGGTPYVGAAMGDSVVDMTAALPEFATMMAVIAAGKAGLDRIAATCTGAAPALPWPTRTFSPADALAHVFGYFVANDVSARDWQFHTPTFTMGKSFDTHGPIGPWIVTADEVPDPQNLSLRTRQPRQLGPAGAGGFHPQLRSRYERLHAASHRRG